MDQRLQLIALLLAGETMAEACRQQGSGRTTGYK